MKSKSTFKHFVIACVAIIGIIAVSNMNSESAPELKTIDYELVATNGNCYDIFISPDGKTLENMKLLAVQLEKDYGTHQNADVFVFDDKGVAEEAESIRASNLDDDDPKSILYDIHFIGIYWKTPSGRHDFTIMLDGMNGSKETIDYRITDLKTLEKELVPKETKVKASRKIPLWLEWGITIAIIAVFIFSIRRFKSLISGKMDLQLKESDPLPVIESTSIILQKNEICHFSENANYVLVKNVITGRRSSGNGRSAKILGVRYSDGTGYSQNIRENIAEKTPGVFTVTSERIVFSGMKGAFEKKIHDITSLTPYDDGIGIQFGDKHFILQFSNAAFAYQIIMRLLNAR